MKASFLYIFHRWPSSRTQRMTVTFGKYRGAFGNSPRRMRGSPEYSPWLADGQPQSFQLATHADMRVASTYSLKPLPAMEKIKETEH